jgi:hypothetical protein
MARPLEFGDEGADVQLLQEALSSLGYTEVGEPDGRFTEATQQAMTRFQSEHGLFADGRFGSETQAAVQAATSSAGSEDYFGELFTAPVDLPDGVALAGLGGVLRVGWTIFKWAPGAGLRIAWFIIESAERDKEDRQRDKTRQAQVEGWRKLGDEARHRTLIEAATHILEGSATSSDADIIAFSPDTAQRIQAVTDSLVELFRSNDHWIGEDLTVDGGFLARMPEDTWKAIESHAETLQDQWFEALRSGEPFNDQLRPTRGPVQVNADDVSRLFFERVSHPQYVLKVRAEPPDDDDVT